MRTALVGGASAGIGLAIAARLAASGHRVVLSGRRHAPLLDAADALRATGAEVDVLVHDMADVDAAAGAVEQVTRRHGGLDVLVLNAGGPPPGSVLEITDDAWRSAFDLLLLGPLRLAQAALPGMAAQGFGRVVVITSTAVRQPQPGLAASTVLRSAVTAAAKLLSREQASNGVTVNCVAPGPTATARRAEVLAHRAAAQGVDPAVAEASDTADVPAGRPALPDEIASAVDFLVSDSAGYVNGTVLTVDGGRTETV
jgi:3-oxoacyl-[acyl-carrier protein] reductase